jgi:N-acyl-D-amino-acid deacylase
LSSPTVITGAEVYDGTGGEPAAVDVAIAGGTLAAVGPDLSRSGAVVIDAAGLVLAPGFIDFHSHADFTLPAFPQAANSVTQGVTTEVLGNCGASPAPLAPDPDRRADYQAGAAMLGSDLAWAWESFAEYLAVLDAARPAVNCVPLVGHGALRAAAIGLADRPASPTELDAMKRLVAAAMEAGAWGMSTGLVYPPSSYGEPAEIAALASVVHQHGGIYASHIRDEGSGLTAAIGETIAVAETTGVGTEVSHLKSSGPANHGRINEALALIEDARERGLPVGYDAYPYTACSTSLSQVLPAWALADGVDEMVARLASRELRARMVSDMEGDVDSFLNAAGGWGGVMVSDVATPALAGYKGRRVAELATDKGHDPAELVFDLIAADRGATAMIAFTMAEDDVARALDHPAGVIGSDQLGVTGSDAQVHPRAYGTFARVLARAVAVDRLPDTIRRMTSLPASRLGLADRGTIRAGAVADLVLFDPQRVRDRATYAAPTMTATGVEYVFVGGDPAIAEGAPADLRRGRVLRRQPPRTTV